MDSHPLRAYDFLASLQLSHSLVRVGLLSVWIVLVDSMRIQEISKMCNGICNGKNLACNGKIIV